ncbi:MAG: DUF861 domain-containing protein [Gammaproteobacteria bacterium]|nr:DUF861 domain-containing protein [Gammaproteobacteria bacterium]NKB63193.1 DUF861 domain-containing protein [Gammaproteobacteria bacterium]
MKPYYTVDIHTQLETLSPFATTAGYELLEGNPQASIRFDRGAANTRHRLGIWRCTPGAFKCTEKGDELQVILKGKLRVTEENGNSHEFGPGDSFYSEKGENVIWTILETVEKVFFTHDEDLPGPGVG